MSIGIGAGSLTPYNAIQWENQVSYFGLVIIESWSSCRYQVDVDDQVMLLSDVPLSTFHSPDLD